jgi:hypothetical protein
VIARDATGSGPVEAGARRPVVVGRVCVLIAGLLGSGPPVAARYLGLERAPVDPTRSPSFSGVRNGGPVSMPVPEACLGPKSGPEAGPGPPPGGMLAG